MSARCPYCGGEVPGHDHVEIPATRTPIGLDPPKSGKDESGSCFVEVRYKCNASNEKIAANTRSAQ